MDVAAIGTSNESGFDFHSLRSALATCHISHLSVEQYGYPHPTAEPSPLLISIVSAGLLGPFAEEMLFRKWLVSMMERGGFNPVTIIVCSSILFFCAHLGDSFLRVDTLVLQYLMLSVYQIP